MTVVSSELLIIELKYDCCILSTLDSLVTKLGRRIHCNKPVCLGGGKKRKRITAFKVTVKRQNVDAYPDGIL